MDQTPTPFSVTSDPAVQITIYDATQTIRGQAEGNLQRLLPPGLYRVHLERCGVVHKEIVDHDDATELAHAGPPLRSPVPFAGAVTSHTYYVRPAQKLSLEDTGPPLGHAPHTSRLFVFLRREERYGCPRSLPSEPVTIHDVDGRPLTTISCSNAHFDDANGYVAFSVRVAPGTYRIRAARTQRDVAITIPDGRAAHVFVADTGAVRLEELRVSLVPVAAGFDPASPIWSAMESVIAALRAPGRAFPAAARALLPDATNADLCFGMAAAHLLLRCDDRPAFTTVMQRLTRFREIPDVAILDRLHPLDRSAATIPKSPPLLRASMVMAMTRTELDSRDVPADCALAQAARRRLDDSIWCTWSTRTWDERWIEPTVERLRSKERDTSSIARSLALPHQTLDATMRALDATMPSANGQPLEAGDLVVPGYSLHQILGRGVQSTVFRARRVRDGATVALKVMPVIGGADECARLNRALDRIERVEHPRILVPTARGTLPGDTGIWLDMELCRGSMLDVLSETDAPLSVPDAWRVVFEALSGLAHLHDRGIVHGDIRPENILIRDDGSAVITDLGLARCRTNATLPRSVVGSPRFASPERLVGDAHPQLGWDVWSMAATLYFLLTLEPPRDEYAEQSQLEAARCNPIVSIAMRRPDVPPGLAQCIDRALSLDARARPIDAGSFHDQLMSLERSAGSVKVIENTRDRAPVTEERSPKVTAPGASVRAIRSRSRRRQTIVGMMSFLGSIAGLCLAGLLVAGSSKRSSAPAPRYVGVAQTPVDVHPAASASVRPSALVSASAVAPASEAAARAEALPPASMQAPLDLAECVEHPREVTACDELSAQKKWRELDTCAAKLETLGCEIQASEFRAKATREARNKVTDRKLRQAFREGRLNDAEALLRLVSQDSVYREALSDLFDRANAVAVRDAKRRSYALASAHECASLKRYLIQQITGTTGTETTIAVIKDALTRCTLGENPPSGTQSTSRSRAAARPGPSGADMMDDADAIPSER